jgi:predicted nucleotidyltransferase
MDDTSVAARSPASGRFVLRIEPALHEALRDAADAAGLSLNEYCARKLAAPGGEVSGPASAAVHEALARLGEHVVGLVAFGSWARGDTTEGSDVDLLVVVRAETDITRRLYRIWDEMPVRWEGREVEPHFVHLPEPGARISGLWAEVAVEGIVLFDPGFRVSRRLAALRRRVLEERLVRRRAHGQPFWVGA